MQQRYYDPQIGRFLSTDPMPVDFKRGQNFNRYWYAAGNPHRFVDPDGRYARGAGFGDSQWESFDRAQQNAATRVDAAIGVLTSALADPAANQGAVQRFEGAFGSGSFTSANVAAVVGHLRGISQALHGDASSGYVANRVSRRTLSNKLNGADATNVFAAAAIGEKTMYVNRQHASASNSALLADKLIHEAGHNAPSTMYDQVYGPGNVSAYSNGSDAERDAYRGLKETNRALSNPDNYSEFVQ